jgi:hypothetical protein
MDNPFNTNNERKKKKKKAAARAAATAEQARLAEAAKLTTTGQGSGNVLSGTVEEQKGQLAGLNLAGMGYGQGLAQTGQDIQGIKKKFAERSAQSGADPVSAAIMGQKQSALAAGQRNLQASGVKGAAAAGALESIGRQKDADIAASLYGQQKASLADERNLASNMLSGTVSTMQGEKAANIRLPNAPTQDSGTFYICTMLRSKNLMTKKESLIMTKFMIKSLITGADFSLWYFKHGKKAVERAEAEGFDWSKVKKQFVDDIITLLKQDKFKEAQSLYGKNAGEFCTQFGAKGFKESFTVPKLSGIFKIHKVLLIEPCRNWIIKNLFNIPRILKVSI